MKLRWGWKSRLMIGTNVVLMGIFALVIVVMANLIGRRMYLRLDVMSSAIMRLSPQTQEILKGLKKPVRMYACFYAYGTIDRVALQKLYNILLTYEYHARRGMLKVEQVDVHRDVMKVRELKERLEIGGEGTAGILNSVVVTCEDRIKIVTMDEMVRYDFSGYYGIGEPPGIKEFPAEKALTEAIQGVLRDKTLEVGFLTGHGEGDIDDYDAFYGYSEAALIMKRAGVEPRKFSLEGRSKIPEELKCLFILGPKYDFLPEEIEMMRRYLEGGGRVFLGLAHGVELKNLSRFLGEFGIEIGSDSIFDEAAFYKDPSIPMIGESRFRRHEITRMLAGTVVVFPEVVPLSFHGDRNLPYEVRPLLETTDHSFVFKKRKEVLEPGPFVVAVAISRKSEEERTENEKPSPMMVVVGDEEFAANTFLVEPGGRGQAPVNFNAGNKLFLFSAFKWLLPEESAVSIEAVPYDQRTVEILPAQLKSVFWIALIVMPSAGLSLGILMWLLRRK